MAKSNPWPEWGGPLGGAPAQPGAPTAAGGLDLYQPGGVLNAFGAGGPQPGVQPDAGGVLNTFTGAPATAPGATGQPGGGWQTTPVTDMSIGGFQNWAQQTFGYQYSPQELQQIAQEVGYAGNGPISGEQMAAAQQAAMRRAESRGWQSPTDRTRLEVEDAPVFEAPTLNLPDAYTGPGTFAAPTLEEMQADPGYQFRLQEGERAMRNAASAIGGTRGSNHLVDLLRYGQEMGSQEYGNIYNRAADTFERNRRSGLDVYDRGRDAALSMFDADFRGAEAEYAPRYDTWTARNRANEINLEDDWRREVYRGDDEFRRDRAGEDDRRYNIEDRWRRDVYGDTRRDRMSDEQWRQLMLEEDRRRYLVDRGF